MQLTWPWNDRQGRLSGLKLATFVVMFLPALWLTYQVEAGHFGPVPLAGMTYWSGVWAMAILLLALAVTPAAKILRKTQLIAVRRMIGVTALVYTFAHIVIYFALRFWDFPSIGYEVVTRPSLIIATISTIGVVALGATSFDEAIRRMGLDSWNRLHNLVYVITLLALIHFLLSPGIYPPQYLMTGAFVWLMAWRRLERRGLGTSPLVLTALAVATALFTAVFEAAWVYFYHDFGFASTFGNNFNLAFGVSSAWKILLLGLVIALAASFSRRKHAFR